MVVTIVITIMAMATQMPIKSRRLITRGKDVTTHHMGTALLQILTREGANKADRTIKSNTTAQINPTQTSIRDRVAREEIAVTQGKVKPFGGGEEPK